MKKKSKKEPAAAPRSQLEKDGYHHALERARRGSAGEACVY